MFCISRKQIIKNYTPWNIKGLSWREVTSYCHINWNGPYYYGIFSLFSVRFELFCDSAPGVTQFISSGWSKSILLPHSLLSSFSTGCSRRASGGVWWLSVINSPALSFKNRRFSSHLLEQNLQDLLWLNGDRMCLSCNFIASLSAWTTLWFCYHP